MFHRIDLFQFLVVSKAEFIFSFFQGFYWIDPNGGLIKDAVKVRCERRTRSTCLYPLNANQVKFITILHEQILFYLRPRVINEERAMSDVF